MTSILAFLEARLADDEALALAAQDVDPPSKWRTGSSETWTAGRGPAMHPLVTMGPFYCYADTSEEARQLDVIAAHIAAQNPTRVLAEVQAKRAIIEAHPLTAKVERWNRQPPFPYGCETCMENDGVYYGGGPCETLLALTLPFRDHPDFDPAWLVMA